MISEECASAAEAGGEGESGGSGRFNQSQDKVGARVSVFDCLPSFFFFLLFGCSRLLRENSVRERNQYDESDDSFHFVICLGL